MNTLTHKIVKFKIQKILEVVFFLFVFFGRVPLTIFFDTFQKFFFFFKIRNIPMHIIFYSLKKYILCISAILKIFLISKVITLRSSQIDARDLTEFFFNLIIFRFYIIK
jgi:hypothetical protein